MLPTAALTASLPYARMALGAFVAAGAWCAGQYVTARAIRRMDPRAFGESERASPMSQAEKIRHLQTALIATAADDHGGSVAAAMQDPDTLAAIRAMDRLGAKAPLTPANDQAATTEVAA